MRRFVLLLSIVSGLFGQTDGKSGAVSVLVGQPTIEWIRSGEPLKEAWAAHWAAEQHIENLVPELLRVLAAPLPMPTGEGETVTDAEAARLAILDALIQMKEPVRLADLVPFIEKFPTEVLILAARSQEDNSSLLVKLLDRPHNHSAFIAIGELLTPRRDAGFALKAIEEFEAHDEIMVFNPGQDQNSGSGWGGDSVAAQDVARPGWPATGTYVLMASRPIPGRRLSAADRANLIADGRYQVLPRRSVGTTFVDHGFRDLGVSKGNTISERAEEFLTTYLDLEDGKLPVHAADTLKLTWAGADDFRSRVRQFFVGQRLRFAGMLQELITRKYLTVEQAGSLKLRIKPYVTDERGLGRTEVPDVGALAKDQ